MLRNLRKEVETVANLATWASTKHGPYSYTNRVGGRQGCALSQYFTEMFGVRHGCDYDGYWEEDEYGAMILGTVRPLPKHFNAIACGNDRVQLSRGWTFERMHKRALKYDHG